MGLGFLVLGVLLASLTLPASAQTVVDGDTIDLNGTRWRLWGIDAPETRQSCADGWPAGLKATAAMRKLTEGRAVVCEFRGHDRYKRSIGLCRAGGKDLGAEMVSASTRSGISASHDASGRTDASKTDARHREGNPQSLRGSLWWTNNQKHYSSARWHRPDAVLKIGPPRPHGSRLASTLTTA
jgi:hypothetical protein